MCLNSNSEWTLQSQQLHSIPRKPTNRARVRVLRLSRKARREERVDAVMEFKNLKLYMDNISIIEQNERLRRQASLLRQENLALMSKFERRFPNNINE